MSLSAIKVTHGLLATFTAESPAVAWREQIGSVAETVTLQKGTHGYEITATLGAGTNALTLDLSQGTASVTGSGAYAAGTLTLTGNAVANETVTIGGKTYTWKASVTTGANEVKIGASASDSLDNLIAAINHGAGSGTVYGSATTAHPSGTAAAGAGDTLVFTATAIGTGGNSIATTETMTNGSWGAATLTGGLNASTLIGGDGKDNEGTDIPAQNLISALRVRCTAGIINVTSGTVLGLNMDADGVILFGCPGGSSILFADDLVITANVNDSAVIVEVISYYED